MEKVGRIIVRRFDGSSCQVFIRWMGRWEEGHRWKLRVNGRSISGAGERMDHFGSGV